MHVHSRTYDRFNSILIHRLVSTRAKLLPKDLYGTADTVSPTDATFPVNISCSENTHLLRADSLMSKDG